MVCSLFFGRENQKTNKTADPMARESHRREAPMGSAVLFLLFVVVVVVAFWGGL